MQIKQFPNQSFPEFVKLWKGIANKITLNEHELKHIFVDNLLPQYKLFAISHHDLSLGDMINTITKKEEHIKKLFTINDTQITQPLPYPRIETNNFMCKKRDNSPPKPPRHYTPLTDTLDNILKVLLDEELINLPPMVEHKFPNGVPYNFYYEEFCNYHHSPGHLTHNYKTLKNLIQDFIDKGAIPMDSTLNALVGPIHLINAQLGIFTNPLPSPHKHECIGNVGISHDFGTFFVNKHHFRNSSTRKTKYRSQSHGASVVHSYPQAASSIHFNASPVPLFFSLYTACLGKKIAPGMQSNCLILF